jgi:predicted Zn-dependent protease
MLVRAGIDPQGLLDLFDLLRRAEPRDDGPPGYLRSHPLAEDRLGALSRLAAGERRSSRPLMSDRDWGNVTRMCR